MNLEFDKLNLKERPTLVLETLDFSPIAIIGDAYDLKADIKYNEISEIEFSVPHYVNGDENAYFDDVTSMRIVHVVGLGRFRLVSPQNTIEGFTEVKVCKGYSLESELANKTINLAQGTYNLWNPINYGNTIIGMFLEDFPAWRVNMMVDGAPSVAVDTSLYDKYRTFEVSDNWYNFIKSTVQQSYQCVFEFDSFNRVLSVRAASEGADQKPVFIAPENLAKDIKVEELTDDIYTCFDVYGASDVNIRTVNPTGTNKIYDLSYYMRDEKNFSASAINPDCKLEKLTVVITPQDNWNLYPTYCGPEGCASRDGGFFRIDVEGVNSNDLIYLADDYQNDHGITSVEALDGYVRINCPLSTFLEMIDTPINVGLAINRGGVPQYITLREKYQTWCERIAAARDSYYSYSMRRANIYVEYEAAKAAYTELQGEYTNYENLFSVAVQAEKANVDVKESSETYQKKLKETYGKMVDKAQEIDAIENRLKELQEELDNISDGLAFEKYFTEEELVVLTPYVKESVMSESTFVASNTATYGKSGAILKGEEHSVLITDAPVVDCHNSDSQNGILSTESSIQTYRADGGQVKISYVSEGKAVDITGDVQRAVYDISETTDKDGNKTYKLVGSIVFQKNVVNDDGSSNTVTATLTIVKDGFDNADLDAQTTYDYEAEAGEDNSSNGHMKIASIKGATLYLTSETTEFQRNSVQWELYDYAWDLLTKSSAPSYSFTADVANFLTLDDFEMFKNQFSLGERVYLQLREGYVLKPIAIGISFEYDDPTSMSIEFANQFNSNSGEFGILDIFEKSVSLGSTVDTSRFIWEEWSNGASSVVKDYMTSELNAAKQRVVGATNQAVSFDGSGVHLRRYKDGNTQYKEDAPDMVRNSEYDPHQAWLTNGGFLFTDDGWESVRMAIGLHSNGNYGIIADEVVGEIFIGEKLYLSLDSDDPTKYISMNENGMVVSGSAFRVINSNDEEKTIEEIIDSAGTTSYKGATPPSDPKVGDLWFCFSEAGETVATGYEDSKWYRCSGHTYYPTCESIITQYGSLLETLSSATEEVDKNAAKKAISDYEEELKTIFGSDAKDLNLVEGDQDEQTAIINQFKQGVRDDIWDSLEEQVGLDHVSGALTTNYVLDKMTTTTGNLYMGESGLWLIDTADPTTAKKAVWVNGSGIMIADKRKDSTYTEDPSYKDNKALDWMTAISADGVRANQFIGDSIFGEIQLGIGKPKTTGVDSTRPFYVDANGYLHAQDAEVRGDIYCDTLYIDDGDTDIKDLLKSLNDSIEATDDALALTNTTLEIQFTTDEDDNVENVHGGLKVVNTTNKNELAAVVGAFDAVSGANGVGMATESGYPLLFESGSDMVINADKAITIGASATNVWIANNNVQIGKISIGPTNEGKPTNQGVVYINGKTMSQWIETASSSGGTAVYA